MRHERMGLPVMRLRAVVLALCLGALAGCAGPAREQGAAMQEPQDQAPRRELAGTTWTLVHFRSSDDRIGVRIPPNPERYTLTFGRDGSVALRLDCNRGMGRWEATPSSPTGGSLTIRGGAMTRAFCGPDAMDTQIALDLARVRSYTFTGERLSLALEADAGNYLWMPAPAGN